MIVALHKTMTTAQSIRDPKRIRMVQFSRASDSNFSIFTSCVSHTTFTSCSRDAKFASETFSTLVSILSEAMCVSHMSIL